VAILDFLLKNPPGEGGQISPTTPEDPQEKVQNCHLIPMLSENSFFELVSLSFPVIKTREPDFEPLRS